MDPTLSPGAINPLLEYLLEELLPLLKEIRIFQVCIFSSLMCRSSLLISNVQYLQGDSNHVVL